MNVVKCNNNQKGFSLIELMVVVVILGMITLGLVAFFSGGVRSWIGGQSQLQAQREARQAMDRMVREIREGKLVTGTNLSIDVDIPALGTEPEKIITFSWSGTPGDPLYRGVNILIENVKQLNFNPDPKGSQVHILLEIDVDDDEKPDISLNSDVNLRNYGLDL